MISFSFHNTFQGENQRLKQDFFSSKEYLAKTFESFKQKNQGFYTTIDESTVHQDLKIFAQSVQGRYDHIVVLGIGGSALGMKVIRDALWVRGSMPQIHIVDNVDPDFLVGIENLLHIDRTLFLVISKSGGTTETMTQYFYFQDKLKSFGLPVSDHCVFITGRDSLLHQLGKSLEIPCFFVPETVGGRFSVLTAVGLLPALLMGIDIDPLLEGAKKMRDRFVSLNFDVNLPFQLAVVQYLFAQKKYTNNVMMAYSNRLKTLSEWYAQLLGESTGKIDRMGSRTGITPISALGATDQHSQLQLYSDGPLDKLICFVRVNSFEQDPIIQVPAEVPSFAFIQGVRFGDLLNMELQGTADALTEKGVPSLEIQVSRVSPETIGALFFLFEGATAFLGEFLDINAFDQPGVERSKILTKEYLKR